MQGFNIVNEDDKRLVLGCLNTTLLLTENNIYNLQHQKSPLDPHQKEALARLQYEKNHIELLKAKLLETMPEILCAEHSKASGHNTPTIQVSGSEGKMLP